MTQLSKKQGNARENKAEEGWATAVRMKDQEEGEETGTRARNTITVEKVAASMCRKEPRGLVEREKRKILGF